MYHPRNKSILVRLTETEHIHLKNQAATAGFKVEPFVRSLINGSKLKPRPTNEYACLLREISAIGNNINQIARRVNSQGYAGQNEIHEAAHLAAEALKIIREEMYGIHKNKGYPSTPR